MNEMGKLLVVIGLLLALAGGLLWSGVGRSWLGKLPGDFSHTRGNVHFYFPLMTCLLISVILSFLLWLLRKF